jgi:response regulator RpfG family c-di-GMP phosphodiesterase
MNTGALARLELEAALRQERTLLIVDDEPGILAAISRSLEMEGYRILTAGSGREALGILARNPVQVILSDERMPEMSGTEFLGRVKMLYPHTVRMVLTGYTELEAVARMVNQSAIYKFLTKPWEYEQLREQVRDAFDYHEEIIRPRMEESTPAADPRLLIDKQSSSR